MVKDFFSKILLSVFFLAVYCCSFGQVKFYAETDSRLIGKDENIEILFTVKNAKKVEQINAPVFEDFTIVSGPSQQSGMTIINGNVSQTVSIGFTLHPKKVGVLRVGSATAVADGKTYTSAPLTIQVTNKVVNNNNSHNVLPFAFDEALTPPEQEYNDYILKKGENVAEKIKKNVFVRLEVDKTKCYVGEPIVASYKLYSRLKTESSVAKTPSFNGFSVNELGRPDAYNLSNEHLNGRDYNVYLLRKVELYPLQAGKIELEPLEVENKITFIEDKKRNSEDIQNMLQGLANGSAGASDGLVEQAVTLKNKPVTIEVLPLPKADTTLNFKGAVGEFEISSFVDKPITNIEEGGMLTVTIKGKGNIQLVNAPKVMWPSGIDGFEPISSEKLDKFSVPISGEKYFKYPFSVSKTGRYEIPAVVFSYFDVNDHSYHTVKSEPITVDVSNASHHQATTSLLQKKPGLKIEAWIFIIGALLLFVIIALIFRSDKNERLKINRDIYRNIAIENEEQEVGRKIDFDSLLIEQNTGVFYRELKSKLFEYLSDRFSIPRMDMSRKKINDALDKRQIDNQIILELNKLFDDIDLHLYSASAPEAEKAASYKKVIQIIRALEG